MSALLDINGGYMRDMTESDRREIRMYGTTVDQMREAVEQSITFRFSGPAMMAMSLMSDCQEMVAYGPYDSDTLANNTIRSTSTRTLPLGCAGAMPTRS